MDPKFVVPRSLEDLTRPAENEDTLYAQDVIEIDELEPREIHRLVTDLAAELADKDVICVVRRPVFDKLYSFVRGYGSLEVHTKIILIDGLCTNLSQLNVSTTILINSMEDSTEDNEDVPHQSWSHCNAIKVYAYFLLIILTTEVGDSEPPENRTSIRGSKSRVRKKHLPQQWDWSGLRSRVMRVLAGALQNDLSRLFHSQQLDERLIAFLTNAAFKLLEDRVLLEKAETKDCKEYLFTIIAACALKYGYGIPCVVMIIDMLHKHEHLPKHIADLVSMAEHHYTGSSMAVDLLRAIGQIDPKSFERDNCGAENLGSFLEELTIRLPKVMMTNLSVIVDHLDGKSHKMRNSLVKVIGSLLVEGIKNPQGVIAGNVTRLRSEQALLTVLVDRTRDVSAHTRKHVLQTWAYLSKEHAVPMGHWNLVSEIAAGRLEDVTAIVRKSALQLLGTLLEYNPFGPSLRQATFEATLQKYKEKLAEISPPDTTQTEEAEQTNKDTDGQVDGENLSEAAEFPTVEQLPSSRPSSDSRRDPQTSSSPEFCTDIGGLEHTRALVASLESALRFSKCLGSAMEVFALLLASPIIGDVESVIQLLMLCKRFDVDGSSACLRKALPLVFSPEQSIKSAVEKAFKTLFLEGNHFEVATNLTNLTLKATLGDLASIEALVSNCMLHKEILPGTVSALWDFFTFNAQSITPDQSRAALGVLCMAAKANPHILSSHLQNILDIGFGRWAKDDVLLARWACIALQRLPEHDRMSFRSNHKIFGILSNLILSPGLPEACWYSAAEQAINAIYALHPAPENFSSGILVNFAHSVFLRPERSSPSYPEENVTQLSDFSALSAVSISRFLFAVAHVALKHLVYIEACIKQVRTQRRDRENSPSSAITERQTGNDRSSEGGDVLKESIATELGMVGSDDALLDELGEQCEGELIRGDPGQTCLISTIAPLVSNLCFKSSLLQQSQRLRSSAMLALCKLMTIDSRFCENHLQLLFTVAQNSPDDSVRSNCVICLGDLALRFPNLLEPWMESMYARVHDQSIAVRKNTILVLSHLILNDLIKVKGFISEIAIHIEDEDPQISDLAKLFFHELSKKGNNPVFNLLPDILSRLSCNPVLPRDNFSTIMQFLIGMIKKSKQMEGLVEKFCNRFAGTSEAQQWQDTAFCLCQLACSQSCVKKLTDLFKVYQHALGDVTVFGLFKSLIVKTRKLANAELKLALDEFEEKIMEGHSERREQEDACRKALEHHQRTEALQAQYASCEDSHGDNLSVDETSENYRVVREPTEAESTETCSSNKSPIFRSGHNADEDISVSHAEVDDVIRLKRLKRKGKAKGAITTSAVKIEIGLAQPHGNFNNVELEDTDHRESVDIVEQVNPEESQQQSFSVPKERDKSAAPRNVVTRSAVKMKIGLDDQENGSVDNARLEEANHPGQVDIVGLLNINETQEQGFSLRRGKSKGVITRNIATKSAVKKEMALADQGDGSVDDNIVFEDANHPAPVDIAEVNSGETQQQDCVRQGKHKSVITRNDVTRNAEEMGIGLAERDDGSVDNVEPEVPSTAGPVNIVEQVNFDEIQQQSFSARKGKGKVVTTRSAVKSVVTRSAVKSVVTRSAVKSVVTRSAVKGVVTRSAVKSVVTKSAATMGIGLAEQETGIMMDETPEQSSVEETSTQPYPYMDLDLEIATAEERPRPRTAKVPLSQSVKLEKDLDAAADQEYQLSRRDGIIVPRRSARDKLMTRVKEEIDIENSPQARSTRKGNDKITDSRESSQAFQAECSSVLRSRIPRSEVLKRRN